MKEVITIHLQSRSEWLVIKMVSSSIKRDVKIAMILITSRTCFRLSSTPF